jgi:hypothetical protein
MYEFVQQERFYCRNPRCRSKLPAPVANPRDAFCARGCHASFYLRRCLVCEGPITRKRGDQKLCRKAKCHSAWRARSGFGRYAPLSAAKSAPKTPDFIDSKQALEPDRPWRIIAGPELTASAFHCATVGQWREANTHAQAPALIKRGDPPINIVGGYKFPNAPVIDRNVKARR